MEELTRKTIDVSIDNIPDRPQGSLDIEGESRVRHSDIVETCMSVGTSGGKKVRVSFAGREAFDIATVSSKRRNDGATMLQIQGKTAVILTPSRQNMTRGLMKVQFLGLEAFREEAYHRVWHTPSGRLQVVCVSGLPPTVVKVEFSLSDRFHAGSVSFETVDVPQQGRALPGAEDSPVR